MDPAEPRSILSKLLRPFIVAGTSHARDESEERRIRLTNMSGLIGIAVNYGYVIIYALLGWWPIVAFNSVAGLGYPAALWLNARRHDRIASIVLLLTVIAQVTAVPNIFLGVDTGIHYFLFVVTPTAFILLSRRDFAWALWLSALSIACFAATEYLPRPEATAIQVAPAAARLLHGSSTIVTIVVVAIIVFLAYAGLESAQTRLRKAKQEVERAAEQMRRDLEAAAQVQAALLPTRAPEHAGARCAWVYRPSSHLGGDLLNIFQLDEHRIGMYVLDASGHGVQAALLSVAVARSLSPRADRSSVVMTPGPDGAPRVASPADVARQLNALYPFDGPTGQFMTLVYAILDCRTGEYRYVCAGHPGPLHIQASGQAIQRDAPALPIGIEPHAEYRDTVFHLSPEDRVFLYSDGLFEQESPRGEPFGLARVHSIAAASRTETPNQAADSLVQSVLDWGGARPLRDDVTVLALHYAGTPAPPRQVNLSIPHASSDAARSPQEVVKRPGVDSNH